GVGGIAGCVREEGALELFFRLLPIARPKSGRNSFTTPNPMLPPIVMPKLTAASPGEFWLGGSHVREMNAPAATPPSCEIEIWRRPSSCRARIPLASAYFVRRPKARFPELK